MIYEREKFSGISHCRSGTDNVRNETHNYIETRDLPAMIILQNWTERMSLPLRRFKASMNGTSFDVINNVLIEF